MIEQKTQITDVETLQRTIDELENRSAIQLANIKLKANHLKENFFLKTDIEKYSFDKGQQIEPELLKLLVSKILRPKTVMSSTLGTLVSTFVVQKYGKKLSKQLKKLLKHLLP